MVQSVLSELIHGPEWGVPTVSRILPSLFWARQRPMPQLQRATLPIEYVIKISQRESRKYFGLTFCKLDAPLFYPPKGNNFKKVTLCLCPSDSTCVQECPVGYYAEDRDERVCERCHFSCKSCAGRHSVQCVTCKTGFFKQGSSCVEFCSERLEEHTDTQSLHIKEHHKLNTLSAFQSLWQHRLYGLRAV